MPAVFTSFAEEAVKEAVEKDLDWATYDNGDMEGATIAYLILAIINWLMQWFKYFIYIWWVLDL